MEMTQKNSALRAPTETPCAHFLYAYGSLAHGCSSFFSEYIQKYATAEALREPESESDSEMSDLSEDETRDMEL